MSFLTRVRTRNCRYAERHPQKVARFSHERVRMPQMNQL
jgi:hypothetical protein